MPTTITEALAELKTIDKRIDKKTAFISQHAMRESKVRDPLEKDGGSSKLLAEEMQAITDLELRKVTIRTAIQAKNLLTQLTLDGKGMSLAEWLHWRREVAAKRKGYIDGFRQGIISNRSKAAQRELKLSATETADAGYVIVHLDELALAKESEHLETILGELDGKLSLLNATTVLEI